MKITKLEHACLDITDGSDRLIIDPGVFTKSLTNFAGVTALIITHVHADHLDESLVHKITEQNPSLQIFCTDEVAKQLSEGLHITVPNVGTEYKAGAFTLEFFGGIHATIQESYPQNENYGVLVNGTLYYPGDSFTQCPKPHAITAAPSMAPWLKISEAADFIRSDTAKQIFPTHDGLLNSDGAGLHNSLLGEAAEHTQKTYKALAPGESLEV